MASKKKLKRRLKNLTGAVNEYLLAQNGEGYKDGERARDARIHLCRTVYRENVKR